jgi:hypothetical protein
MFYFPIHAGDTELSRYHFLTNMAWEFLNVLNFGTWTDFQWCIGCVAIRKGRYPHPELIEQAVVEWMTDRRSQPFIQQRKPT